MSDQLPCPHCGGMIDVDDYDWGYREERETECDDCERPIVIHRRVSVDYEITIPKTRSSP